MVYFPGDLKCMQYKVAQKRARNDIERTFGALKMFST